MRPETDGTCYYPKTFVEKQKVCTYSSEAWWGSQSYCHMVPKEEWGVNMGARQGSEAEEHLFQKGSGDQAELKMDQRFSVPKRCQRTIRQERRELQYYLIPYIKTQSRVQAIWSIKMLLSIGAICLTYSIEPEINLPEWCSLFFFIPVDLKVHRQRYKYHK